MSWFTRFTRFGDTHLVYSQEGVNACGIACVRMVMFKVNKLKLGATAITSEKALYEAYSSVPKPQAEGGTTPYDGTAYTYATHLATTLNKLVSGPWVAEWMPLTKIPAALIKSVGVDVIGLTPTAAALNALRCGAPVILLVGWSSQGAHFVVVDTLHKFQGQLYASVCDPWDGDVHVTPFKEGMAFTYTAQDQSLAGASGIDPSIIAANVAKGKTGWSLGSSEHSYANAAASGSANGWIIRRKP